MLAAPALWCICSRFTCHRIPDRSLYAYVFAALPSVLQSSVALRFPTQPWHVLACQLWLMFLFSDVPAPHHAALAMVGRCEERQTV